MFARILAWVASGGLSGITTALQQAYEARLRAQTDSEKLATDLKIRELESRRDIILAAQADKYERWIRILIALPFVAYLWKLVVFDKILGMGATDALSPMLTQILWTVIGGYFVLATAKVIRK